LLSEPQEKYSQCVKRLQHGRLAQWFVAIGLVEPTTERARLLDMEFL
jgi:hypothetical protein